MPEGWIEMFRGNRCEFGVEMEGERHTVTLTSHTVTLTSDVLMMAAYFHGGLLIIRE